MGAPAQAVYDLMTDCKSRLQITKLEECTEGAGRRLSSALGTSWDSAAGLDAPAFRSHRGATGSRMLLAQPAADLAAEQEAAVAERWLVAASAWGDAALAEGLRTMGPQALRQLWQGLQLEGLNQTWQFWE